MHTVIGTAANVKDVTQATGCMARNSIPGAMRATGGVDKRQEMQESKLHKLLNKAERLKASVRAKVGQPFRVIKQPYGHAEVRSRVWRRAQLG